MADELFKIVNISERLSNDKGGRLIPVMRVEYVVGDEGPFVEEFPKEGFNHEVVRTKLGDVAKSVRDLMPDA